MATARATCPPKRIARRRKRRRICFLCIGDGSRSLASSFAKATEDRPLGMTRRKSARDDRRKDRLGSQEGEMFAMILSRPAGLESAGGPAAESRDAPPL